MKENGNLDAATETPSDGAPEDMTGTPPTEDGDEIEVPGAEGEAEAEPEDATTEGAAEEEDAESWKALRAKYPNLSDKELRAQVGDQYWEAKNYASRVARENEELREQLAKEEPPEPEEPDEPPSTPQIEALDKRIQTLYQKDQTAEKQQQEVLVKLADADKNIAKIEARLEDSDDEYRKESLKAQLEAAQGKRQSVIDRYGNLNDKREGYAFDMERLLTDKDWLIKAAKQQRSTEKSEQAKTARFNAEFPKYVDTLITKTADGLDAPPEERFRQSLWNHVNRAMMVDLMNQGDTDLEDLDVPQMVESYVKEYLTDRDLVSRTRFEKRSAEKRKVTGKNANKPVPVAKKPPVPPSLMSTGDTTPQMLRARKYLRERGL